MQTEEAIVSVVALTMMVGIPMMGLTIRYSLKPLVDAYVRVREAHGGPKETAVLALEARVQMLERLLAERGADVIVPQPTSRMHSRT